MNFSKLVKSKFNAIISQMCSERSRFVKNPLSDFTRDRKLSMSDTIKCIINMVSGNLNSELLRYFHFDVRTPSSSAFIQQRAKIRAEAFSYLLYEMNAAFPPRKTGKYTFLACDGTLVSIPLPQNSNEQYAVHRKRKETREYYQIHLHTLFDLNSQRYLDLLQEPVNGIHEQLALKEILLRGKFDSNTIIIMDRGYEGHDLFAWMNSLGLKFVCRAKDGKCGGIVKGFHLSMDGEFDDSFDRIYTIKNTKEVNSHPEIYYKVHQSRKSTFFVKDHPDYRMTLRVVRVRLENEYECLITNLTPDEFSMSELKDIYWMRWGIETSFRQLKYTIGLVDFHSKKKEFIEQEIFARMILYNICQIIIKNVDPPTKNRKYVYQINTAIGIYICRRFLLFDEFPSDVETLLQKYIQPIRPGRIYQRNIRYHTAVGFPYRRI